MDDDLTVDELFELLLSDNDDAATFAAELIADVVHALASAEDT